jgi:hypothetical protein
VVWKNYTTPENAQWFPVIYVYNLYNPEISMNAVKIHENFRIIICNDLSLEATE